MDKAFSSCVTLTTLEARQEKVQNKDIRFHQAIKTVVAAPKGFNPLA